MEEDKNYVPLETEWQQLAHDPVLSPAYQKKKLLFWLIRNSLTAVLCYVFWEKTWVKWVLWIGIPLSLINLLLILLGPYLLRKKMQAVHKRIKALDRRD